MFSRAAILGAILAASALVGLTLVPVQTLEVASKHRAAVLWRARAAPGDVVTFSYIHSIEHIPVEGRFAVEADGWLRVVETPASPVHFFYLTDQPGASALRWPHAGFGRPARNR